MLNHIDNLLRDLFMAEVQALRPAPATPVKLQQVGIRPPDQDWRAFVSGLQTLKALNIYLFELRENRRLRSNDRVRSVTNGSAREVPAPARMDCHYLVTAWSPGQEALPVEPTVDEHQLLYEVAAVLLRRPALVPRAVYAPKPLPAGFPALIADSELPTTVLPVEGFPKYAEFWGTMGATHPWKPAVYLVVTVPIDYRAQEIGGIVTTLSTDFRQDGDIETAESLVTIGGVVLDQLQPLPGGAPSPVPDAWVRLETPAGVAVGTSATNDLGQFVFERLRPGPYRLRWRDGTRPEPTPKSIQVPGTSEDYRLVFT